MSTEISSDNQHQHAGTVQIHVPTDDRDFRTGVRLRCLDLAMTRGRGRRHNLDDVIARARRLEDYVLETVRPEVNLGATRRLRQGRRVTP